MKAFWCLVVEIQTFEKHAYKTLTQYDGNGNTDERGDYNSSSCTSYRRANETNANIHVFEKS